MSRIALKAFLLVLFLLFVPATAWAIEVFDSETTFFARAGEVSTVDFADPSVPTEVFDPFLVIHDVRFEISSGRGAECAQSAEKPCWYTVEDRGSGKLLSSAFFAVAMEEWAFGAGDWDVIRFGDKRSVRAFGFYFHSLVSAKPPGFTGWEILVHERDGTATSVTLPFFTDDEPVYRGFVSDTGISMIDIGSMPGPTSFNWAYEAVSHSPVTEHERNALKGVLVAHPSIALPADDRKRLRNDMLERRGGLYYDIKANKPATGIIELPHPGGEVYVRAYLEGGRKNGPETHWYPNGQISSEMFYLNGRKHGRFQEWHEGGEKKADIAYYQGRVDGRATWWHINGQEENEVAYRLGRREGIERRWFQDGQLESEVLYVAGAPEGKWTAWHANGQKHSEGNFISGKRQGRFITWYADGQINSDVQYVDGKAEGLLVEWYENGQKSMEQELKGGLRVGRQTQWYENGHVKAEIDFLNGKFHGRHAWYFLDDSLEMEFYFRDGQLHGLGRQWHANGQLKSEGTFKNGKPIGKHTFWNENGKKLRSRPRDYPKIPDVTG